jgi:hypothetical protein
MSTATAMARERVHDLDIEEWVQEHYGFVPHPFWIDHCRQLYLEGIATSQGHSWHDCPPDKRASIRSAFVYFGLLQQ